MDLTGTGIWSAPLRYGDRADVRARLTQKIDHAFDHDHLKALLDRSALAQETMSADRLFKIKDDMERAEARRLQPFFVRAFFLKAFDVLGGTLHRREAPGSMSRGTSPRRPPPARPATRRRRRSAPTRRSASRSTSRSSATATT